MCAVVCTEICCPLKLKNHGCVCPHPQHALYRTACSIIVWEGGGGVETRGYGAPSHTPIIHNTQCTPYTYALHVYSFIAVGVIAKDGVKQYLDKLKVEQERGITVKAQTCTLVYEHNGENYLINLIDTPVSTACSV